MTLYWHHLAMQVGVRVICVDRPGMGGSTPVELIQRVPVWLETVPALLDHLKIKHVVLASHSCGAVYLLILCTTFHTYYHPANPMLLYSRPGFILVTPTSH